MHDSNGQFSASHGIDPAVRVAYRIREAAQQIGISERQMWRLVWSGEIASVKFGSGPRAPRRVFHQTLVAFIAAKERETTEADQLTAVA